MNISVIMPHLKLYGGVRRFLEIGNEMTSREHEYTIYHSDGSTPDWFKYNGKLAPISEVYKKEHEILLCGDAPSLDIFAKCKARLKIVYIIFPYSQRYGIGNYKNLKDDYVLIGNSIGWEKKFPPKALLEFSTHTVSGGINLNQFKPSSTRADKKFRVLVYAKFDRPWKRAGDVVKALEMLKSPPVLMLYDVQEWRFSTELEIENYVNPSQENLSQMYSKADIVVCPEELGGWCNIAAEAMACKTAVVCTSSGTSDFAIDNETALLFPVGDIKSIANAVEKLRSDSLLRKKIAKQGHKKIQEFDWHKTCDCLEEICKKELSLKRSSWESVADHYKQRFGGIEHIQRKDRVVLTKVIEGNTSPYDSFLDVGCNIGVISETINRIGAKYLGIDISKKAIKYARNKYPKNDFMVGSIYDLSFSKDDQWGVVLVSDVFMHIDDYEQALKKLWRVTEGKLIINVWTHKGTTRNIGGKGSLGGIDAWIYNFNDFKASLEKLSPFRLQHVESSEPQYNHTIFILSKHEPAKSDFRRNLYLLLKQKDMAFHTVEKLDEHSLEERFSLIKDQKLEKLVEEIISCRGGEKI